MHIILIAFISFELRPFSSIIWLTTAFVCLQSSSPCALWATYIIWIKQIYNADEQSSDDINQYLHFQRT